MREIVEAFEQGWGLEPQATSFGTLNSALTGMLFRHRSPKPHEVTVPATSDFVIVSLMLTGFDAELFFDDKRVKLDQVRAGSVNIVAPGVKPMARHLGDWDILQMVLPTQFVQSVATASNLSSLPELISPAAKGDDHIHRIGRSVLDEMRLQDSMSSLRLDMLAQELAIHVLRRHSSLASGSITHARGGLAPWQLRRCDEYLRARLADDVTLSELADLAGLSPFHFARQFKATTGLPPAAYQRRLRAAKAQDLLLATDLSVTEIAFAVGYETPQAFARMFRAEVGAALSDWRRERRT